MAENLDAWGWRTPSDLEGAHGAAVVMAAGIGPQGALAAHSAVNSFLTDYYATPASWPVRKAVQRVLRALNAWLHAQACMCALSGLVFKGGTVHLFQAGDGIVQRLRGGQLEPLADGFLSRRPLGAAPHVEIAYCRLVLAPGDVFAITTVQPCSPRLVARILDGLDPQAAAERLVCEARQGGADHVTAVIVAVESIPEAEAGLCRELLELPLPPPLVPGAVLDGYRILELLHGGERSQVWLAEAADGTKVALKVPAAERSADPEHLKGFLVEEWVARRLHHPNAIQALPPRRRSAFYVVSAYVPGRTLTDILRDAGCLPLETVQEVMAQVGRAVQAMHRLAIVHGDLRPDNILVGEDGTVRLLDFGATWVAGFRETQAGIQQPQGALQYCAPECLLGAPPTARSDIFSLGVIAYQMLTGRLPYGPGAARCRRLANVRRLRYRPAGQRDGPTLGVDEVLRRAVNLDPQKRYREVAEFIEALRHPVPSPSLSLAERHPARFWQGVSLILALALILALGFCLHRP